MPYCGKCGAYADPSIKFCGICGAPVNVQPQQQQPSYAAPPQQQPPSPPPAYQQPTYTQPPYQPTYQTAPSMPPPQTAYSTYQQPSPPIHQPPQQQYQPPPPPPPQPIQQPPTTVPQYRPSPPSYQPPPAPPMPPPPPQPQNTNESVIGTILLRKSKSLGRYDTWTAVVTNYRVIFAQMTSQMVTDAAMQARDQAKREGRGFFGQWEEQLRALFSYTQKYLTMDPNTTLAETPGNFALDNNGISEVQLKLHSLNRGQQHEFQIFFASAQGTYEFKADRRNEWVDLLRQVYGDRVKMPFGYFSGHGVNIKVGPF